MYVNNSFNILDFPFQECAHLGSEELSDWADKHNLRPKSHWMLPQIVAYYGKFIIREEDTALDVLKRNVPKDNDWAVGLWKVITQMPRSSFIARQCDSRQAMYSALTPIILYGIREAQGIPYSRWKGSLGCEHLLGPALYEAVSFSVPQLRVEELLEIRDAGLEVLSGSRIGKRNNPATAWRINGLGKTALAGIPNLAACIVLQTWAAHPSNRHPAMILDLDNWDNMPEPFITSEVLVKEEPKPKPTQLELPW